MIRVLRFTALCSLALMMQPPLGLASEAKDKKNQAASQEFFTDAIIRQIHLELPSAAVESLKKESRKFVRGTVKEGGRSYLDVGIHLKGVGSFRPIEKKPSFTVKFNEFIPGQRFYGLTKILLNNSAQDPTYIHEALCTALFRQAGAPAARVSFARVWLNERYLGLYVLVEGLTKDFLKLHFKNCDGSLYEAYVQDVDEELKQDNGNNTSRSDLQPLIRATQEADASLRWQSLQKVLDVDRFISMMAGEILMAHWDGYWMNHNNYRIYHDTARDRMILIPYGLDSMFQQPAMSWQPRQQTLLVQAVMQTSEGQRRYRERILALREGIFQNELLQKRVDEIARRLRPILAEDQPSKVKEWEGEVNGLREHIAERMKHLAAEMAPLPR